MMLLVTLIPYQRSGLLGKRGTSAPLTAWNRKPPPLPLSAALPMMRLALITSPGPAAVAQSGNAIVVGDAAALDSDTVDYRVAVGRSSHDQESAAVGRDGRVGALVEENRVVLDVAVVAEPELRHAAAITGAHVSAYPVVVELVVVGAGAEGDAARTRRRGREQLVAGGGVRRDHVVVDVHVQVEAVRQLRIGDRAVLAGAGRRDGAVGRKVRIRDIRPGR